MRVTRVKRIWYRWLRVDFRGDDMSASFEVPANTEVKVEIVSEQYFQIEDCYGVEVVLRYSVVEDC